MRTPGGADLLIQDKSFYDADERLLLRSLSKGAESSASRDKSWFRRLIRWLIERRNG
jgi:hypothetical protein